MAFLSWEFWMKSMLNFKGFVLRIDSLITFILAMQNEKEKKETLIRLAAEKQPNSWPSLTKTYVCQQPLASIDMVSNGEKKWEKEERVSRLMGQKTWIPVLAGRSQHPVNACASERALYKTPFSLLLSAIWTQLVSRYVGTERRERGVDSRDKGNSGWYRLNLYRETKRRREAGFKWHLEMDTAAFETSASCLVFMKAVLALCISFSLIA